jgi:hypothetical protein
VLRLHLNVIHPVQFIGRPVERFVVRACKIIFEDATSWLGFRISQAKAPIFLTPRLQSYELRVLNEESHQIYVLQEAEG